MMRQLSHSQNFIKNKSLVDKLLKKTNISKRDLVLDIGAGTGIITEQLCQKAERVIAIEKDSRLFRLMSKQLQQYSNITMKQCDILDYKLPKEPYKVFANIPFNYTADIVRKLLFSKNPPEDAYLFMQKEAAERFEGKQITTMISLQIAPLYTTNIIHSFGKTDFTPIPNVEVVLVHFAKRNKLLLEDLEGFIKFVEKSFCSNKYIVRKVWKHLITYRQLKVLSIRHGFSVYSNIKSLSIDQWIAIYGYLQTI